MIKVITRFWKLSNAKITAAIICIAMMSNVALAQDQQISGTVLDETGAGLPGASVLVKGSSTGTVTDLDGKFSISAGSSDVLVISFIGYTTQEVAVGGKSVIDVSLEVDAEQLDEVVVVGYGTQKRAEVTGAIASVDSEILNAVPTATVDQALQGRAAGVTVINNGSPGSAPTIRIRGLGTVNNNNPLYVIDGVISSSIGSLNSSDIESIQVLKDASTTAVYGSKGSNGVIVVTTKSGKSGQIQVSLNAYAGSQWTDERFDLLNTDQYIDYVTDAFGAVPRMTDPQYASMLNNNTDWQDAIFQSGAIQNYNAAVSGGGENSSFRISAGYLSQDGVIVGTSMERYNFRANSNFTWKKLKIGENISVAFGEQNPETNNGGRSAIEHAIKSAPYLPIYDETNDGGFRGPNTNIDGQDAENPLRVLTLGNITNKTVNVIGNIYAEYEIIEGLNFKTQVGAEYSNFEYNSFTPSYNDDSDGSTHTSANAAIGKSTGSLFTVITTNSLNYKKTFAEKHNVEVLALAESTITKNENLNARSNNYITNDVNQVGNTESNVGSFSSEYRRIGYLGRLNYNYDGKYLISASFRRDASSRFGANERWGTFPSVSAGWRLSEESFISGIEAISNLKLRASWGKTGNDNIPNYQYSTSIASDFHYPIMGADALGATAAGIANADLKWEETTMQNIGLDLGFFQDKITLSAEIYKNQSDDLLLPLQLPSSLGFHNSTVIQNVGSMETKGFEMNIGYNDFSGDFKWSVNLNFGTSQNEVLDLGANDAINGAVFENESISRTSVGHPAFQFYGWQFDGIFQTQAEVDGHAGGSQAANYSAAPGDFRIVDVNGDGAITADDRTFIGNPFPDFTYGLNLSAEYKGLDFSLFFSGISGNDIYNTNMYDLEGMPRIFNSGTAVLDRWTATNASNTVPRAAGAGANTSVSSRFVEDGSFSRLRNVTLGYDLASSVLKGKITKFRIYVSAQNLLTFTDYSGLDPEVGAYTVSQPNATPGAIGGVPTNGNGQPTGNFENGIDRGNYPVPKSFIGGIEILF
ncbi:MAG: TonB-dependent receptor [Reichenbachiella sp.]